jgi:type II secretory ATPase GspE/PulE/Tfp pilus assembly ATPase PilB-like protein
VLVHEDIGLTFAAALKAFLRQDPNIIMVGEIRDLDTASIAVKAALTGHLVLSTLHTNDAPSAIGRMIDMGIEPFLVASSVNLILAQRLVRRVCAACKQPIDAQRRGAARAAAAREDAKGAGSWRGRLRRVQQHRLPRPPGRLRGDAADAQGARPGAGALAGVRDQEGRDQEGMLTLRRDASRSSSAG